MSAAGGERTTPGSEREGGGQLGGDTGEHAGQKATVVEAMATLGRGAEAAALGSALAVVAVSRGSQPPFTGSASLFSGPMPGLGGCVCYGWGGGPRAGSSGHR